MIIKNKKIVHLQGVQRSSQKVGTNFALEINRWKSNKRKEKSDMKAILPLHR